MFNVDVSYPTIMCPNCESSVPITTSQESDNTKVECNVCGKLFWIDSSGIIMRPFDLDLWDQLMLKFSLDMLMEKRLAEHA